MTIWQSILLGIVQGLTEFLPVSSKGHLLLTQTLLGIEAALFFDVLLHMASLVALIVFFWKRWKKLTIPQLFLVVIASVPVIVVGLLIEPYFEAYIKQMSLAGFGWLVTAGLLFATNRYLQQKEGNRVHTPRTALVTGLFQIAAFIPGISRSGSTLSGSVLQGIKRDEAFSFAFLLAVPAILGAFVLELTKVTEMASSSVMIAGFVSALLTSFLALKLLEKLIDKAKLHYFAWYCLCVGLLVLAWQFLL